MHDQHSCCQLQYIVQAQRYSGVFQLRTAGRSSFTLQEPPLCNIELKISRAIQLQSAHFPSYSANGNRPGEVHLIYVPHCHLTPMDSPGQPGPQTPVRAVLLIQIKQSMRLPLLDPRALSQTSQTPSKANTATCAQSWDLTISGRLDSTRAFCLLYLHSHSHSPKVNSANMATMPKTPFSSGLLLGGQFGKEGINTPPSPGANLAKTVLLEDGYTSVSPLDMYRFNELAPDRREPSFPGLHNLHDNVMARTLNPPAVTGEGPSRRARLWDIAAEAVRKALIGIPAGSHINICANR